MCVFGSFFGVNFDYFVVVDILVVVYGVGKVCVLVVVIVDVIKCCCYVVFGYDCVCFVEE